MPTRNWQVHLAVVGLRFRWKKDARRALADMIEHKGSITGIRLEREPDNEYDPNAIAVYLPERIMGGKQLGYIGRQSAELLAPKLDSGSVIFKRAELESLDQSDSYSTGELLCHFQDAAKKPKRKVRA